MKVFHNDVDWFIANDKGDLATAIKEYYGFILDEVELDEYEEQPLDHKFIMVFDKNKWADKPSEDQIPLGGHLYYDDDPDLEYHCWCVEATNQQWVDFLGRGFMGSTEW